jgi:hypothetical protein
MKEKDGLTMHEWNSKKLQRFVGSFKILKLQFSIFCMLELADTRDFSSRTDIAWEFTF